MSHASAVRLAGVLLISAVLAPASGKAGQAPTAYANAIAKYQNREMDQAIGLLQTMDERQIWDDANRFSRELVKGPAKWLPIARAAALLHTEIWFGQGPAGLKTPRNVQFDSARAIIRVVQRAASDLGPSSRDAEFVRDWYLLVIDFLHGQADVGKSRPLLEEVREFFPTDSMVLMASGADHEMLSFLTTGYLVNRDASGAPRVSERLEPVKELERAARFYREALKHDPQLVEARLRLGHVLYRLGQVDAAAIELDFARLTTNLAHLRYLANVFLGMVESARDRRARAADLYAEATRIYPHSQTAVLAQSELAYLEGRVSEAASRITEMLKGPRINDPWFAYLAGDWWHFELRLKGLRAKVQH